MSHELEAPTSSDELDANPVAGGPLNSKAQLIDPPSQLAYLKDYSTVPNTYLKLAEGYIQTTSKIAEASKFLVVDYGEGNWYIVTVDTHEYLSYTNSSYLYTYGSWSNARYVTINPVSFNNYPGLYLYKGYVCCNGVKDSPGNLMNVHPEWLR